jgi:Na+/H+ antiporter NhaC
MKRSVIDPLAAFTVLTYKTFLSFQFSKRWMVAITYGFFCHLIFTASVLAMLISMFFGMSQSIGNIPTPFYYGTNLLLLLQFPLAHSFLLSSKGRKYLLFFSPKDYSQTLASTVFALFASFGRQPKS